MDDSSVLLTTIGPALRDHASLLILAVLYDLALRLCFGSVASPLLVTLLAAAVVVGPFWGADALLARHGRGIGLTTPKRMAATVLAALAVARINAVFLAFKPRIFLAVRYGWDVELQRLDVLLHGTDPGLALMSLPRGAFHFLDVAYWLWYPVVSLSIAVAVFAPPGPARSRFLLSLAMLWIVGGTVLAAALPSAGPVYYAKVVGQPDPFQPLVQHLQSIGLVATRLQDELWRLQAAGTPVAGGGVSAMPSIHVGLVVLIAIGATKVHRWLGIIASVYAATVFIGSVALGWHYAVDGYAAAVLVAGIWWLSGLVPPVPAQRALSRSGGGP